MAEGFEPCHVPQQSRRDKLRIVAQNHPQDLHYSLPLYDPSLLSSSSSDLHQDSVSSYHPYLDPQSSNTNPTSAIHGVDSNFFPYTQNFKVEPLSLSLSSQSNLPLELNLQRYGGYAVSGSVAPRGPFTGYASVLKGSMFLKPAQQLLEEFCDAGRAFSGGKLAVDASLYETSTDCLNSTDGSEGRGNKSRLISMLDEVYRRYKYYYQQIQTVVSSFECVAGLGNAAPFAHLAFKTLSKHFMSLKDAITDQLQFANKGQGKDETAKFGNCDKALHIQRPVHDPGFRDHQPVWRPQRGLPERAVAVLKAWLFEHFLHPYPTDADKLMLAKRTGLSRSQVSNWFINARVRLWKPMVEEIHMLETRQAQKGLQRQEQSSTKTSNPIPKNPSTSTQAFHDIPSKQTRNDLPDLPSGNLAYNGLVNHSDIGISLREAGRNSGVSLTLGLHQDNGMGALDPFQMNPVQRFGVGIDTSDGFGMGGFEARNRLFG